MSGIEIDFAPGTTTAIVGPTGTGKSVFLRTLNRMNDKVTGFSHDGDVAVKSG